MSFLAEVLSSAEKIEIDEINEKVPELKLKIDNLKGDIVHYTDNLYINYKRSARPKRYRELLNTAQQLQKEINTLQKNAESATKKELLKSSEKLTEHVQTLDILDFSLHVLSNVCNIVEKLEQVSTLLQDKEFFECKKIISDLKSIIAEIPNDEKLIIIDELKLIIKEKDNHLLNESRQCFTQKVITKTGEKNASLKIVFDINSLDQALLAMFYNQPFVFSLSELAKFLWDYFFVPIVDSVVEVKVNKTPNFILLQIDTIETTNKSPYTVVFSHIKTVLEFLQTNFNFPLSDSEDALTTVEYIGFDIRDNLSELIIKHCLVDTIPSTVEGLQKYKTVIQDTEKLELVLRESKFFSSDTTSLLKYANNIDFHFINKKCEEYSFHSTQIMKKYLHDMIEVGVPYNPDNPLESDLEQFLQCSISKSVIELIDYCENILQEAANGSDMSAGRLLITCQNILRDYVSFVPEYHSKLLKTIPQQVALFHNNCFYISHKLNDWNGKYIAKMPSTLNLSSNGLEFEVRLLQQVGSETFTTYIKGQMKQINEIMKDCGLDGVMLEGDLKPITEKCVRQCLRQQELLKTVWHKVLSYEVYNKTMGIILNTLCTCLINPIINFEDISSDSAKQLVEIIKMVISRGPKLFTEPKEVNLFVQFWYKLNELNFVLDASLVDINDRWADGKGPLALQFKPIELKSLIRALFQNTDRRAAMLAKIQE